MSHEVENFELDVIERSHEQPVLVDFWAEWCGPCRTLGPVLEKMETESGGTWRLAKVDVDQNQNLAQQFRVQGIPACKLFVDGEVVGEFTGALPESQIARWLEDNLPSEGKQQLGVALDALRRGEVDIAIGQLESLVAADESDPAPRVLLAETLVFQDPARAAALVDGLGRNPDFAESVSAIGALVDLLTCEVSDLEEHPIKETYVSALEALRERRMDAALEGFLAVLMARRGYDDGGARRGCVAIFNQLGSDHPLTVQYRRRLQTALN